jgi:hypothetical protein
MRFASQIRLVSCCLLLSTSLFAAKITGKVTNGTTNKPSAGDDVVLLSLAGGMQETSRTKSDSKGEFSLDVPDEDVQHLIRVAHQRVNYFRPAPKGTTTIEVTVYDSAKKVDNLIGEGRVFRVQSADGQQIQISEMYILRNESQPPRTWMGDRTFEVVLPEGATLEEGMVAGPGGMPVTSAPVPTGVSNHYAFIFPIRPGRSQLQVTYKLPYKESHDFSISPDIPLAEFGVMFPKGMRFTPTGDSFSPASDESGMTVFVAKSISPGQQLKFGLAGEGTAPREAQGGTMGGGEGNAAGNPSGNPSGPGGGLGTPIGAPDPLGGARWFLLGLVLVGLAGGVVWMIKRKPVVAAASPSAGGAPSSHASPSIARRAPAESRPPQRSAPPSSMLDALKEELFQLEADRLQGKISQQEYEKAKGGLDALMRRHMKKD